MRRAWRLAKLCPASLTLALALSGCALLEPMPEATGAPEVSAAPAARPAVANAQVLAPVPQYDPRIVGHFARLEAQRRESGLLREDRAPRDLPVTARDVTEGFVRIALHDEYTFSGGQIIERKTPAPLRRWQVPVRMQMSFGDSVPEAQRATDRAFVTRYAVRLASLTGHPVSRVETGGNFHVLTLTEEERRSIGPQLRALVPGVDATTVGLVENLPLSVSCLVLAFARGSNQTIYTDAIAIVRAELPDLSRRACYYEELAQGLGLANDSPRVRPSLFNDTAEFAVMTRLDEYLLRVLYDPRLSPGMREPDVRPLLPVIVADLLGGES